VTSQIEIAKKLQAPFDPSHLEWRIGQSGITAQGKPWAKILCYLTARAVQDRLDEVFGVFGWSVSYREWQSGGPAAQICAITVKSTDGSLVTKEDGAESTDIESVKGGISSALKRAAVAWGIGRYLYDLGETWAECSIERQQGWNYVKDKTGKAFYWRVPEGALPDWARPGKASSSPPAARTEQPAQSPPQQPATQQATAQPAQQPAKVELPEYLTRKPGWHPADTPGINDWVAKISDWRAIEHHRRFSAQNDRYTQLPNMMLGTMLDKELRWWFENFHIPQVGATDADWMLRAGLNIWFKEQATKTG
jgi:hypothetical protein